jgi:hypothetical protein
MRIRRTGRQLGEQCEFVEAGWGNAAIRFSSISQLGVDVGAGLRIFDARHNAGIVGRRMRKL